MTLPAILLPLFVQVALTFFLGLWMARVRIGALQSGQVRESDINLRQPRGWPEKVQKVSNAFHNQLEMPILFYVLVALAVIARKADLLFVALSWVFVVSRLVHAALHTTGNVLKWRGMAFGIGVFVLMIMWAIFAVRVLFL